MTTQASPLALIILISTIIISLYGLYKNRTLMENWMMHPWSVIYRKKWYLVFTSGFIHSDIPHLLFNMLTFYFFAFTLENTVGSINFAIIYFGSMVLADVTTILKQKDNPNYYALGASGGISGILFSFILFYPETSIAILFIPIGIPAPIFGLLYLAYCYWAAKKSMGFISHEAHFWGATAGLVLTVLLFPPVIPYFLERIL